MEQSLAPTWSDFFVPGDLEALQLGFNLPEIVLADPNEKMTLDSYDGRPALAWTYCTDIPEQVPPVTLSHEYVSSGRCFIDLLRARRLLLHELAHVAGTIEHNFAFAATLSVIFWRDHMLNRRDLFFVDEYDVHQDGRSASEVMHFALKAGREFSCDTRSVFDLVPELWKIQARANQVGLEAAMPRWPKRFFSWIKQGAYDENAVPLG